MPDLSDKFRRTFHHTSVKVKYKGSGSLKSILRHPKDKIPLHLKQNNIYKWPCPKECCSQSYIGESSRCLGNRVKGQSSHVTSAIYSHNESNSHPHTNIFHFKVIYHNSKQITREAKEAIQLGSTPKHSIATQVKCTFQKSSTAFWEQAGILMGQSKWQTQISYRIVHILLCMAVLYVA